MNVRAQPLDRPPDSAQRRARGRIHRAVGQNLALEISYQITEICQSDRERFQLPEGSLGKEVMHIAGSAGQLEQRQDLERRARLAFDSKLLEDGTGILQ